MEPGIYPNLSHADYHALTDIISNSYLGRLNQCPANAKVPVTETTAMSFGRALHSYVLDGQDVFDKEYAIAPTVNKRTKDGREVYEAFCEDAEEHHKSIIDFPDYEKIMLMHKAIMSHPLASVLLKEGRSETSIFWTDEKTKLPCKCRPDRIPEGDHGVILDLKSARSAELRDFTNDCIRFGYARQAGIYIEGFNSISSAKVDAFVFICIEKDEPYRIEVFTLDDNFIFYGQSEFHRLLKIEKECRAKKVWPNYKNTEIRTLYLPNWTLIEMGEGDNA